MGPVAKDQLGLAAPGAEDHFLIRQNPKAIQQVNIVMPREGAIIFGDLVGKLDMLRIECPKCGRSGRHPLRQATAVEPCVGLSVLVLVARSMHGWTIHILFMVAGCPGSSFLGSPLFQRWFDPLRNLSRGWREGGQFARPLCLLCYSLWGSISR